MIEFRHLAYCFLTPPLPFFPPGVVSLLVTTPILSNPHHFTSLHPSIHPSIHPYVSLHPPAAALSLLLRECAARHLGTRASTHKHTQAHTHTHTHTRARAPQLSEGLRPSACVADPPRHRRHRPRSHSPHRYRCRPCPPRPPTAPGRHRCRLRLGWARAGCRRCRPPPPPRLFVARQRGSV